MKRKKFRILDLLIDFISWQECIDLIISWSKEKKPRSVFLTNVHSVINAEFNPEIKKIFNNVDLSLPDGRPLTWISYLCGNGLKQRISGPDLMIYLLNRCNKNKLKVYFYGSSQKVLNSITNRLNNEYKNIEFSVDSPPYRLLTEEENIIKVKNINSFEPNIIFVGLGHPKQEEWIFKNRNKINSVMIGVGAAFDFYSGHTRRAPKWMRIIGLEWLYRLIQNPRRLFKRYLISNTFFIFFGIIQVFKHYVKKFFR